jgi:hypothetical protein
MCLGFHTEPAWPIHTASRTPSQNLESVAAASEPVRRHDGHHDHDPTSPAASDSNSSPCFKFIKYRDGLSPSLRLSPGSSRSESRLSAGVARAPPVKQPPDLERCGNPPNRDRDRQGVAAARAGERQPRRLSEPPGPGGMSGGSAGPGPGQCVCAVVLVLC